MTRTESDHDSQEAANDCPDATLSRRDLLRATAGAALFGMAGVPRSVTARLTAPGEERWNTRVGTVEAAPAVTGGTVFIGSSNANLHALNTENGEERWSFGGEDRASRQSSPTVVDGTVYVGSFEGNVYAVDAESGDEQWRFEAGGGVFTTPAVVDGTVFVGSKDGNVYALNAGNGEERWRYGTGGEVWGDPTVVDGTVLVGSDDGRLYALNADDGSSVWEFESSVIQGGGTTVADETVYFSARSLHALDMAGEERWSVRGGVKESVAVVDGTVFIGESAGVVRARDAANGDEIWSFETGDTIWVSPTVAGETVYVGSEDDFVYALDAETGEEHWSFDAGSWVRGSATVAGGMVFVGSLAGVYALTTSQETPTPG